jgi:hypothetical protein
MKTATKSKSYFSQKALSQHRKFKTTRVIYTFRTKTKVWRIQGLQNAKPFNLRILKAGVELLDRLN